VLAPLIPSSTNCLSGGTAVPSLPALIESGCPTLDCVRGRLLLTRARVERSGNWRHKCLLTEAFRPADPNQARNRMSSVLAATSVAADAHCLEPRSDKLHKSHVSVAQKLICSSFSCNKGVLPFCGRGNSITSQPLTGAERMPNVALLIYLNLLQEETFLSPNQVGGGSLLKA